MASNGSNKSSTAEVFTHGTSLPNPRPGGLGNQQGVEGARLGVNTTPSPLRRDSEAGSAHPGMSTPFAIHNHVNLEIDDYFVSLSLCNRPELLLFPFLFFLMAKSRD